MADFGGTGTIFLSNSGNRWCLDIDGTCSSDTGFESASIDFQFERKAAQSGVIAFATAVPEPATLPLVLTALAGVFLARRRA